MRLQHEGNNGNGLPKIPFYRIDLSKQDGPVWDAVGSYLENNELHIMKFAGAGSVLWIIRGQIVDGELGAYDKTAKQLAGRTASAFGESLPDNYPG
jgi:hypothetical protein